MVTTCFAGSGHAILANAGSGQNENSSRGSVAIATIGAHGLTGTTFLRCLFITLDAAHEQGVLELALAAHYQSPPLRSTV